MIVLSLLCATILLSACGSDSLSDALTREDETYVGEFKSLGGVEVQDVITHLFETEDGDVLYAYSDRYDLDSSDYDGVNVEAYGMVTTYEDLDKPLFEVQRITDAPLVDETATEVTMLDYQNPSLGFSMSYPSDWTVDVKTSSVVLTAPIVAAEEQEGVEEFDLKAEEPVMNPVVEPSLDTIEISQMDAALVKTSEDTQEDRAAEVRSYVVAHYASLVAAESELAYVGTDRLLSVRYKTSTGNTFYFIPREEKLYELSYNHESESDTDRLTNSNTFATLASGFRFTTYGELMESPETPVVEEDEPIETEEPETTTVTPTEGQVSFSNYRELESKPYEFKMSYPGNWYYAGSSTGYTFSDTSTDDEDSKAILTMTFNGAQKVGFTLSGDTASVTVEVEGRSYTISGPAEYQSAMQIMADSISSTATNDKG